MDVPNGSGRFGNTMISFQTIFLVISSLVVLEYGHVNPFSQWDEGFVCSLLLVACATLSWTVARMRFCYTPVAERRLNDIWSFGYPWLALLSGWADNCSTIGHSTSRVVAFLLLFLWPMIVATTIDFASGFRAVRAWVPARHTRLERWLTQLRGVLRAGALSSLALCLIPALLVSVLHDMVGVLGPAFGWAVPLSVCLTLGILAAWFYPSWIGKAYGVSPLRDPDVERRLKALSKATGVRQIRFTEVPSHGSWAGAAVLGWFPSTRTIWLGDALLARLDEEELDMVVLHELAHILRRHTYYRLLPLVWSLVCCVSTMALFENGYLPAIPAAFVPIVSVTLGSAVMLAGLGLVSKSCELDADRAACGLASDHCDWGRSAPSKTAAKLISALKTANGGSDSHLRSWLHPCLKDRIASLAMSINDSKCRLRLHVGHDAASSS